MKELWQLPSNWEWQEMREFVKWTSGGTPKATEKAFYENGTISWLITADLNDNWVYSSQKAITDLAFKSSSTKMVEIGSVLVAMYGSIGKLGIAGIKCCTNQAIAFSKELNGVDNKYLFYYFKAIKSYLISLGKGGTQANISLTVLNSLTIPLPPTIDEQCHIVARLEDLLLGLNSARDRLEKIPAILRRFRQSVLSAACSGRLTAEWREGNECGEWEHTSLCKIIKEKPRNGYSPVGVKYITPYKNLTLTATTSGKFKAEHFKYIDISIDESSYLWLKNGDILVQRSNSLEHVGVCAIYDGEDNAFVYPDLMMKIVTNTQIALVKYVYYSLSNIDTRIYFMNSATGTAGNMPKINQQTVLNTPVYLPPLPEQEEIVRRVDQLFALADSIEQRYNTAKATLAKAEKALYKKAFSGEL